MKILVVGSGGREHAIIKKLKESKHVDEIFALPGNGGMAKDATLVPIGAKEIDKIAEKGEMNMPTLDNLYKLTDVVKNIDKIVMLEHGRVVATGSHEELLATSGPYRNLIGKQLENVAPV